MAFLAYVLLFLSLTAHSSAFYCVCKDGVANKSLQEAIDYACGAGADCTPILQNGPCFQPNTVKDHCNYAVNSYYQRKGNIQGSCDFAGAATTSQAPPPTAASGCVYPSSPGSAGTPSTGSPGSTPGTGTGTGTGATAGSPTVFGISPTSSTIGDPSTAGMSNMKGMNTILLLSLVCYLVFSLHGLN